jgi:hypothetical protein
MTELNKYPAQPHIVFLLDFQGAVKLMRSDITFFSEQFTDADSASTRLVLDCTAET